MKEFKKIEVKDFYCNPFEMIGNEWMLITAKNDDKVNTMTASWGGMGVIWNKNVVYIFVRKSRYTKEFIDQSEHFSISFYDTAKYRKQLAYLGKVSGRDEDKIAKADFHVREENAIPYFEEAKTVLMCRKLSIHPITPDGMLDSKILPQFYADRDYHDMYIGEIVQILEEV